VEIYAWFAHTHGTKLTVMSNRLSGEEFRDLPRRGALMCDIPEVSLMPGAYLVDATIVHNGEIADGILGATQLDVEAGPFFAGGKTPGQEHGTYLTHHSWALA
jgi:hypothetical protein